jgi:hypothetical protein
MPVYCKGVARITCTRTLITYEVKASELMWQTVKPETGHEIQHEARVTHPKLGLLAWTLWEYPEGSENGRDTEIGLHTLDVDFEFGLMHGAND